MIELSIVKIQQVRNLKRSVKYITQDHKTEEHLITCYECNQETIQSDFQQIQDIYNQKDAKEKPLGSRMIIQSFDPDENISPEQAHQFGLEYARQFLGNQHQFICVTHTDTNNLHNHIIFNNVNFKELKMFNSKRSNSLHRLRHENDLISEKYGLSIIENTKNKSKFLSFNEYVSRSKGTSFKEKIENDIDDSIKQSNSFNDFLDLMSEKGYEYKQGKYLSFKHRDGKKYMRTKTLGFNYLEKSIEYRINNKDYIPVKTNVFNRDWIDKTQEQFKNNKGLRKWATVQNINYLNDMYSVLKNENLTLEEFQNIQNEHKNLVSHFEKTFDKIDNKIFMLERMNNPFLIYKSSYSMIVNFKKLETEKEKIDFKKEHFHEFKAYDLAKRNMGILKKVYNINNENEFFSKIDELKQDRDILYSSLNVNQEKRNIDVERDEKKTKSKDIER